MACHRPGTSHLSRKSKCNLGPGLAAATQIEKKTPRSSDRTAGRISYYQRVGYLVFIKCFSIARSVRPLRVWGAIRPQTPNPFTGTHIR